LIAIIDYGMGNLRSVKKAFDFLQVESFVTSDKEQLKLADKIVLPGVGAFEDAMKNLESYDLKNQIIEEINNKKPFLGICLGLQMLFEFSQEGNLPKGLSLLKGSVVKFDNNMNLKVPHMGWNNISVDNNMKYLSEFNNQYFYFVHSYFVKPEMDVKKAHTNYGIDFVSAIEYENILATQFHPEKSGKVGLKLLEKWARD